MEQDPNSAEAWCFKGLAYWNLGNAMSAADCFKKTVNLDENHFSAWNHLGMALGELGFYEYAISCFVEADKLEPDSRVVWSNVVTLFRLWGKYDAALSILEHIIKTYPGDINDLYRKSDLLALIGQKEESAKVLCDLLSSKHKLNSSMIINIKLRLLKLGYWAKIFKLD